MKLTIPNRNIIVACIFLLMAFSGSLLLLLTNANPTEFFIYSIALAGSFLILVLLLIVYRSQFNGKNSKDIKNIEDTTLAPVQQDFSIQIPGKVTQAGEEGGIWELDIQSQKGKWSEKMFHLLGMDPTDEPPALEEYMLRVHPEDRPLLSNEFNEARNPEIIVYRTNPALLPLRYLMLTRTLFKNKQGQPVKFFGTLREITGQQNLENKIIESEEKYRTLVEQISDAIFIIDKNGKLDTVNSSAIQLSKYTEQELLQMFVSDFSVAADHKSNPFHVEILNIGGTSVAERILRCKNGEIRQVEVNAKLIPGGYMLAMVRDISERVKTQNEILREKTLSDSIINALPGIFYFYTREGKFIRWNKNFETVSGYSAAEISNMHPQDFIDDENKSLVDSKIQNVFASGEDSVEAGFLLKSGQTIPHHFTGKMVEFEGKSCLLGVGIDCSERQKAQEQMRLSEKKYRILFEDNPMPLWIYSLKDLHFIDVNEAAIKHYGYTKEEFKNMTIKDIRPQEDISFLSPQKQTYRGIANAGTWRHLKKGGAVIRVEIFTHDTYFEGEHVRLVLANDITDKYIAEEKLRESLEEVRQLSSHQHLILEEERRRIGREIHDDLGQHLTAIKMDIAWVERKISDENAVVKSKVKNVIEMLDASNLSVRRILSELRPAVLDDIGLLEAIEWLGTQFTQNTSIPVKFASPQESIDLPEPFAVCIYRVCQEAFTNITRYANATGVSVCISSDRENITVIIEDDGKGFNLKAMPNDRPSFGILGMKERALALGGQFELTSSPGIGTKITMVLPVAS
jgi:PAS domain S-box-containing protein